MAARMTSVLFRAAFGISQDAEVSEEVKYEFRIEKKNACGSINCLHGRGKYSAGNGKYADTGCTDGCDRRTGWLLDI